SRAEPTHSQRTSAVVFAVREVDCFRFSRSSFEVRRFQSPGTTVPESVPPIEAATSRDAQSSPCHHPRTQPMIAPTTLHNQTCRWNLAITARYIPPTAPITAARLAALLPH